jgi:lipoprotein NlpD
MIGSFFRTAILVSGLLWLAGCASRPYRAEIPEPQPPVAGRVAPSPAAAVSTYRVRSGDTLHSIAFAAGTDWQTLARLNGIPAPYTIYPGQILKLGTSAEPLGPDSSPDEAPAVARARPAPEPEVQVIGHGGAPVPPAAVQGSPVQESASRTPPPPAQPGGWQWPGAGKLILGFSAGAQPHKGIDIAGSTGDPVFAAKGGTVVYAGNGVRGYGNLLIVKHDELFLSAYAHNSKLLVKEGDVVKGGQQIAQMGDSGTDRTKLHFEVRKQGNPVDPLQVLPRR